MQLPTVQDDPAGLRIRYARVSADAHGLTAQRDALAELFGVGRSTFYRAVARASARTETTAPGSGTGAGPRPARERR